MHPETIWVMAS